MEKSKKIEPPNYDGDISDAEILDIEWKGDISDAETLDMEWKGKQNTKKGKKTGKERVRNPPIIRMITNALTTLKSRQGSSLVAIRNFIKSQYNLEMTKQRQTLIKKVMTQEFNAGRIIMTNLSSTSKINFTKRFNIKN